MSNTLLDAKQAIKYILDGFIVIDVEDGSHFKFTDDYLVKDLSNEDEYTLGIFFEVYEKSLFRLEGKNLIEWYRIKSYWRKGYEFPKTNTGEINSNWMTYGERIEYLKDSSIKVIEWETKLFPAKWEECE